MHASITNVSKQLEAAAVYGDVACIGCPAGPLVCAMSAHVCVCVPCNLSQAGGVVMTQRGSWLPEVAAKMNEV